MRTQAVIDHPRTAIRPQSERRRRGSPTRTGPYSRKHENHDGEVDLLISLAKSQARRLGSSAFDAQEIANESWIALNESPSSMRRFRALTGAERRRYAAGLVRNVGLQMLRQCFVRHADRTGTMWSRRTELFDSFEWMASDGPSMEDRIDGQRRVCAHLESLDQLSSVLLHCIRAESGARHLEPELASRVAVAVTIFLLADGARSSQSAIARIVGIRREYVNRVKCAVIEGLNTTKDEASEALRLRADDLCLWPNDLHRYPRPDRLEGVARALLEPYAVNR